MITTITPPSKINTTITYEGGVLSTSLSKPITITTVINVGRDGKDADSGSQEWSAILNKPTTFPPEAHTHSQYALSSSLSTVATSGSYSDLVGLPTLGTASALNVSTGAVAASGEVVKGNDTRLSDARTPLAHNHSIANVTGLQTALDGKYNIPTGDTTQYIAGDGSLVVFPVAGQAGTLVRQVRNETGSTLTKGTVVYINGASGNKPTVTKAIATSDDTSAQTFGIVQADILTNQNGYVVVRGDIVGLDTSAYLDGAQLYLSGSVAGTYTTVKPVAPIHLVYIGIVTRSHNTQGQIEVAIQNGYEIDELHDVLITSKQNNDVIVYEQSTNLWKNKTVISALGYTPYNAANPNGYTANATDAQLRDRSTHTGTQLSSTISDFTSAVDTRISFSITGKENTLAAVSTGQYWRGDKTWQTLDKSAVGLSNVDNTSDANKPVSTATQAALDGKQPLLTSGVIEANFGAIGSLGTSELAVVVTGQSGITSSKYATAKIELTSSSDHSIETHQYAATLLGITTGNIVDGVGFTIYLRTLYPLTGKFNIRWMWQ